MEILRARLFESENHQHGISFLNMPRSTGRRAGEALPCKAKRRLFQDDSPPPSGLENSRAQANLRINTEASSSNNDNPSESERLQERFADIEVFEDPPTPYRTVCHSAGKRNGLESTRKVEEVDENVEEPTSSRMNSRSSVTEKQSRLPEYFKPKKRARTTASPLQKTPKDQMRTRRAAASRRQRASTLK